MRWECNKVADWMSQLGQLGVEADATGLYTWMTPTSTPLLTPEDTATLAKAGADAVVAGYCLPVVWEQARGFLEGCDLVVGESLGALASLYQMLSKGIQPAFARCPQCRVVAIQMTTTPASVHVCHTCRADFVLGKDVDVACVNPMALFAPGLAEGGMEWGVGQHHCTRDAQALEKLGEWLVVVAPLTSADAALGAAGRVLGAGRLLRWEQCPWCAGPLLDPALKEGGCTCGSCGCFQAGDPGAQSQANPLVCWGPDLRVGVLFLRTLWPSMA